MNKVGPKPISLRGAALKPMPPEARILAAFIKRLADEKKIRVLAGTMIVDKRQQVAMALHNLGHEQLADLVMNLRESSTPPDLARLLIQTRGPREILRAIKWSLDKETLEMLKFSLGNIGRRDIVHFLEQGYFPADKS
jgi:hypothetical protein